MSITVYVYKPGWRLLIFLQGREREVVVPTGVQLVNTTTHTLVQETDLIGCHVLTQTLEIWRSGFFFFLILAALWNAETFSCGMWPLSCGMWPLSWNMWDLVLGPGKEPGPPVLEVWGLGQLDHQGSPLVDCFDGLIQSNLNLHWLFFSDYPFPLSIRRSL